MPKKQNPRVALTRSEPLAMNLADGRTITGALRFHASEQGRFQVEYRGMVKSDGRSDYTNLTHMRLSLGSSSARWQRPFARRAFQSSSHTISCAAAASSAASGFPAFS